MKVREIEEKDLNPIVEWRNNPKILKWLISYLPLNITSQKYWYDDYLKDSTRQLFIIEYANKSIGLIGLKNIDYKNQIAELTIYIDIEYQNKNFGSQSLEQLINFAFNEMNLRKIKAVVFSDNEKALHFYNKFNFVREGTFKKEIYKNGEFKDLMLLALFRK